jgi:hypothetical protein
MGFYLLVIVNTVIGFINQLNEVFKSKMNIYIGIYGILS